MGENRDEKGDEVTDGNKAEDREGGKVIDGEGAGVIGGDGGRSRMGMAI